MLRRRNRLIALGLLLLLVVAAACSPAAEEPAAVEPETSGEGKGSVAMILPGPIGDQGWNTSAYLGLQEYEEQGYRTAYVDEVPDADNEGYLRSYGEQGFDLVVGHGFTFVDPVMKVAPEFPETNYFITAGLPPEDAEIPSNVGFMKYHSEQACYLAGMLAGAMSESGKIGYVGAQQTPICLADLAGYKLGAREVNPDIEVMDVWAGVWEDPAKGREVALTLIGNGADVLLNDADLTGTGALEAGKEEGVYLVGMVSDQSDIAPELFLTSVLLNVKEAIAAQMERVNDGEFGGIWNPGIAEGVIDIAPLGPDVPDDLAQMIEERKQQIADGEFEVPAIYEEMD